MKEYLVQIVQQASNPLEARNRVREYLQARVLLSLQRQGAMVPLAFHGGTALRFLFRIPRFSEDLDFALERPEKGNYDLQRYVQHLQQELTRENYIVDVRLKLDRVVHIAWIRFRGLLNELRLSPHAEEKMAIKIEVDTRPPSGARLRVSVIRPFVWVLRLQHHDLSSILAGKIHALLQRPYLKGRDVYDLFWLLSAPHPPEPNLVMLRNALRQTGWPGPMPDAHTWREMVWKRLQSASWQEIQRDIEPFLETPSDIALLTPETIHAVLFPAL